MLPVGQPVRAAAAAPARDVWPGLEARSTYELILEYCFTEPLVKAGSRSRITPRCAALGGHLYESAIEMSCFSLYLDSDRSLLGSCDVVKAGAALPVRPGAAHTLRLQLRHERISVLEALKESEIEVVIERPLARELRLKVFSTRSAALLPDGEAPTLKSRRILPGTAAALYVRAPKPKDLPKGISQSLVPGDTLVGDIAYLSARHGQRQRWPLILHAPATKTKAAKAKPKSGKKAIEKKVNETRPVENASSAAVPIPAGVETDRANATGSTKHADGGSEPEESFNEEISAGSASAMSIVLREKLRDMQMDLLSKLSRSSPASLSASAPASDGEDDLGRRAADDRPTSAGDDGGCYDELAAMLRVEWPHHLPLLQIELARAAHLARVAHAAHIAHYHLLERRKPPDEGKDEDTRAAMAESATAAAARVQAAADAVRASINETALAVYWGRRHEHDYDECDDDDDDGDSYGAVDDEADADDENEDEDETDDRDGDTGGGVDDDDRSALSSLPSRSARAAKVEAERKQMEADRTTLIEALTQAALAHLRLSPLAPVSPRTSVALWSERQATANARAFRRAFRELSRWADVSTPKFGELVVHHERLRRPPRPAVALKALNALLDGIDDGTATPPLTNGVGCGQGEDREQILLDLRTQLYDALGWSHWASYEREWLRTRFEPPPNKRDFEPF